MVNLKATVRVKTKNGLYPVYIRFTKKTQVSYIKTAWVVNEKGLGGKKEVIDPYVIQQTSSLIETYYRQLNLVDSSSWSFNNETILSPRASLAIVPSFNNDVTFRIASGIYYQSPFFKELRDTTTIDGTTYATLNEKIKSQRSIHFILGMDYRFKLSNRPFKFSAEAYYKALSDIVPYSVNNVKVVYYGTNEAKGHIAGLDMKLYGEFVPGTDSWITLSIMDTKMNINGVSVPLPTDQRYAVNLSFSDYFPNTDRWKMNLKLAYGKN